METNLKQIVWVCGGVASGKERFIRRVIDGKEPDVCKKFGWNKELPVACLSSLDYVGMHPGDTATTDKRNEITNEVSQLISDSDVVLIKEQRVDLRIGRPQQLQKNHTNVRHVLIILDCTDADERMKRYSKKPFAINTTSHKDLVDRFDISLDMLSRLNNFDVRAIDSSTGKGYCSVSVPAQLVSNNIVNI